MSDEITDAMAGSTPTTEPRPGTAEKPNTEFQRMLEQPMRFGDRGAIEIKTSDDLKRVSGLIFASAAMEINGAKTRDDVSIALMHGMEAGLSPTQCIKNVMIVNGKPAIWGDTLQALALGSGMLEDMQESFDPDTETATCKIVRVMALVDKSHSRITTVRSFSREDAATAGLWGKRGPWSQYPKRMLQMRARAFALRDAFADRLGGLSVSEEVKDYAPFDPAQMTGTKPASPILEMAEAESGSE